MMGEMLSDTTLWAVLLLQVTGGIAAGLALSYLLGRRSARAHQVLLVAMLASVLMPGLYLLVKHFELGVLTAPAPIHETLTPLDEPADLAAVADATGAGPILTASPDDGPAIEPSAAGAVPAIREATARNVPWAGVLLICWAVASTGSLGHLVLRFALGLRLLGRSEALPGERLCRAVEEAKSRLGIAEAVRVRSSEKVRSPIIWCWARRPVLLVQKCPTRREDETDWVGVFCHELAHWKRRDHLSGLLAELLTAALPWHPLAWWVKKRLMVLSERACDDWVVASGQIGVEYAESLLDLSPENQLAFLPTVVGKEKAMKERIRRIVKDRCGNPRVGTRWMLAVSVVAILAAVSVAFAQRRPAQREELQERQEMRELELAGRRNVLWRMLEQLTVQARDTEAALRGGRERGEEGHVLRAELEALRQHIAIVERQLRSLDPRESERLGAEETERRRSGEANIERELEELRRHREELAKRAEQVERELEGLSDDQDEEARGLQAELREIHENAKNVEKATVVMEGRRARNQQRGAMEVRERARFGAEQAEKEAQRAQELAEQARQQAGHLRDLREHAEGMERELAELGERDTDEARELRAAFEETRKQIRTIEEKLQASGRRRAGFEDEEMMTVRRPRAEQAEAEMRDRMRHREELRRKMAEMEHELQQREQRGQGDTDEAQELRNALRRMRDEMRKLEADGRATRERSRTPRRARVAEVDGLYGKAPAREEVLEQIRQTEDKLKSLEEEGGPAAERLRNVLEQLHQRRETLEQEGPPPERRPAGRELEREVEELRGKVNGMHEEMQQMRKMLQQLLERTERPSDAVQEMKEY